MKSKKIIIVGLVGLAILLLIVMPFFVFNLYGRLTAPKLSNVSYVETRYDRQSLCMIVCEYYPKYNYEATGSQKYLIESIAKDLNRYGYIYRIHEGKDSPAIGCYGKVGDRYQFMHESAKPDDYSSDFKVTFYSSKQPEDKNSSAIGCERSSRTYRIEINGMDKSLLGLG